MQTINQAGTGYYQEKSSKFFAWVDRIEDESDARSRKEALQKEHHKAVHVVMAYRLGAEGETEYSTDDGEPNGSAGRPVLNELKSNGLTHTGIWVVRYYGGKNLGVAGLIQAYRSAAADAIAHAILETYSVPVYYKISCAAVHQHLVQEIVSAEQGLIEKARYGETCDFIVSTNSGNIRLEERIKEHWNLDIVEIDWP